MTLKVRDSPPPPPPPPMMPALAHVRTVVHSEAPASRPTSFTWQPLQPVPEAVAEQAQLPGTPHCGPGPDEVLPFGGGLKLTLPRTEAGGCGAVQVVQHESRLVFAGELRPAERSSAASLKSPVPARAADHACDDELSYEVRCTLLHAVRDVLPLLRCTACPVLEDVLPAGCTALELQLQLKCKCHSYQYLAMKSKWCIAATVFWEAM